MVSKYGAAHALMYSHVELVPAAGDQTEGLVDDLLNRPDAHPIAREIPAEVAENLYKGLTYHQFLAQSSRLARRHPRRHLSINVRSESEPDLCIGQGGVKGRAAY